jgi:hypothetical protein
MATTPRRPVSGASRPRFGRWVGQDAARGDRPVRRAGHRGTAQGARGVLHPRSSHPPHEGGQVNRQRRHAGTLRCPRQRVLTLRQIPHRVSVGSLVGIRSAPSESAPSARCSDTRNTRLVCPAPPAKKIALSCCQTAVPKESDVAMGMRASPASFDEAVIVRRIDALSVEITHPCEPDVATTRWSDVR